MQIILQEVYDMSNYREDQIADVAMGVIADNPGIRTSGLIAEVRRIMGSDGEDLEILEGRNDDKFSQKVRNLKSHDSIADRVRTVGERNRQWFLRDE